LTSAGLPNRDDCACLGRQITPANKDGQSKMDLRGRKALVGHALLFEIGVDAFDQAV
jgi:hypothetical protein